MCTAISEISRNGNRIGKHLFGRSLDLERSYGELAVITPQKFVLHFGHGESLRSHFGILGVACVREGAPLYYDAINESGLAMAGLNFPKNAVYHEPRAGMRNVASFELIPWLLGQCEDLRAALLLLANTNITFESFHKELPATPLHWLLADQSGAVTVESKEDGLHVYENPFGVLTNNPDFPYHMTNLSNFMRLTPKAPKNLLFPSAELSPYSNGMGAIGLPGDFSSPSRFVRAVYAKAHTQHRPPKTKETSTKEEITRFFHMMDTVAQPLGCTETEEGSPISTIYTSCADTSEGIYYFSTYACRRIRAVRLRSADLDTSELITFPLSGEEDIDCMN